jgi:hypothetical protein
MGIRGLRGRVGNIQIGEDNLFLDIFPEDRFNSWTIGEIHIIDHRISPNGRRDDFERNIHYSNLKNQLTPFAGNIARRCHSSSQIRNRIKTFEIGAKKVEETLEVLEQGTISKTKSKEYIRDMGSKLREIQNITGFNLLNENIKEDLKVNYQELIRRANLVSNLNPAIR